MAIVPDLSGNNPTDKSYTTPNRSYAGEPNAALTPEYAGELVLDTTNNTIWKAIGVTNDSWVMLTTPGPA